MIDYQELIQKLKASNSNINVVEPAEDGQAIMTDAGSVLQILKVLKEKLGFEMLLDITSADYPENFEVVYHVMALNNAEFVRVKIKTSKDMPQVPSATEIWNSANVLEREVFDMMGITFEGHPNLTRILCRDDFEFNPLRKDFKLNKPSRF